MVDKLNYKSIKKAIQFTWQLTCQELKNVFTDSGVIIIFFAAGLLYPLLYGFVYYNENLTNVPVAVVDNSQSAMSRELIRKIDATPDLEVSFHSPSLEEAKLLFAKNKVKGIIFIPSSFSKDIQTGIQTNISAYASMASMLYYRAMYAAVNYVCLDMGQHIQMNNLASTGLTQRQTQVYATPVLSEGKSLYNPKGGYASFLVPTILILVIQQTLVLGIGILAGTAREENSFHQLIPIKKKYHGTLRIVLGKSFAYLILYVFISCYNLIVIPRIFNLPQLDDILTLVIFMFPLLLACIFFAMSISVFFFDREVVFLLYLFSSIPLLFISGSLWPAEYIPTFWKVMSYFFPSTLGIQGFIKINSMGASFSQISFEYFGLWIQAGMYFMFTFFVYRWQILQSEKRLK